MKTPACLVAALLATSQLSAQNQPVPPPATPPKAPSTAVVVPPPAKPVDPKTVVKPAPEPTIPGQTIARANGTYLGLQVIGGNFVLSFYDKKKKPMAPDVSRVLARWPNLRSAQGDNRAVLNPSGNALVGNKPVVAPFNFILRLTFLVGDGDDAQVVENLTVPFHG
jgi:hypothetical protein